MRDGTGTSFEPMSRDWFTTDPRRDAPNAGVEFDVDAIVVVVTATHPVHRLPSSEEPDPIRSDPTAPEHHGWTPNDARWGTILSRVNRSIAGRARRCGRARRHRRFRVRSRREKQTIIETRRRRRPSNR